MSAAPTAAPSALKGIAAQPAGHDRHVPHAVRLAAIKPTLGAITGHIPSAVVVPNERHEVMNTVLHSALRRDLRRLAEVLRRPFSRKRRDAMVGHIEFVLAQLHHHHRVEDDVIWPAVLRVRPDLQGLREQTAAEYGRLAWVIGRLQNAADSWSKVGDEAHRSAVRLAAIDLETVLEPYLQHDEGDAMPVIARALTAREWAPIDRKLRKLGRPVGMARRLFWLLDDLDDHRRGVVEEQLPRSIFSALKLTFARHEARRARLLWG